MSVSNQAKCDIYIVHYNASVFSSSTTIHSVFDITQVQNK